MESKDKFLEEFEHLLELQNLEKFLEFAADQISNDDLSSDEEFKGFLKEEYPQITDKQADKLVTLRSELMVRPLVNKEFLFQKIRDSLK